MAHNDTPEQWVSTTLGEIVPYGKTQKCVLGDITGDTWVLELEDVEKESSKLLSRKEAKERPFKSTKNRFKEGDVLYGKLRPYLNKVIIADREGVCSTEIIPLDAEPFVFNRYLFYWLKTRDFLNYVNEVSYGVNMPRLGTKDGVAAPFFLAPLAEQKAIAEKLDTLMAQMERTKDRLERIPKILKRFRQSVLAAAVSGKLTEEWRKYNNTMFPYGGIYLSEIILEMRNGLSLKPNEDGIGKPILRISSVRPFSVDQVDIRFLEVADKEEERYSLVPGDLLFTRYNGSIDFVGVCALVRRVDHNTLLYPDKLIRVRADRSKVMPEYIEMFSASHGAREYIYSLVKSTSGQKGISGKDLKMMEVKLPTIAEQAEIVRRVGQLFTYVDTIETQVSNGLERVNSLTQSILAKAFRGELTEQWRKDNSRLISGENSAEVLHEKIKFERKAAKPNKNTRDKA